MAKHPDVLIVGGGVIGLTTAYYLARAGVAVQLIDKGDFGQESSWAGAGILTPGNPAQARTSFDQLRAHSVALFPGLSEELRERTAIDNGYVHSGGLEIGHQDELALSAEWRGAGIGGEFLDRPALLRREPAVNPHLDGALYLREMAQVRNPRHLQALVAACSSLGVDLRPGCPAFGFLQERGQVAAVRTAAGDLPAGRFLLAIGAWTDPLLEEAGIRPGIRPVRGQIVLLNTRVPLFRHIILQEARYLVPRPDGRVLVGSTEEDAGFDKRTTAGAIAELLRFGCSLVPALAGAAVERCWAGLRPGSPDGLPFLGQVPGWDKLYLAAGHFRSGIQLSPGTGLLLKELLLDEPPTIPLQPFGLERLHKPKRAVTSA